MFALRSLTDSDGYSLYGQLVDSLLERNFRKFSLDPKVNVSVGFYTSTKY